MKVKPSPLDEKYCGNHEYSCPCLKNIGNEYKGDWIVCCEFDDDIEMENQEEWEMSGSVAIEDMPKPLRIKKCLKKVKE